MNLSFDEKKFKYKRNLYAFLTILFSVVYFLLALVLPLKSDWEFIFIVFSLIISLLFLSRFFYFVRCLKIGFDYSQVYKELDKVCSVKCLKDFSENLSSSIDNFNLKGKCD